MATISPAPFPDNGVRKLSSKEAMQRLKALSCTLPQADRPTCSGQIFVGLFFDGTGNNMQIDYQKLPPEKRKHTNVVKLFHTFRDESGNGYLRFYIPGVGTPFPEIGDRNSKPFQAFGSSAGELGEDRIIWAFTRLLNAPLQFVSNAPLIPDDQARTISNNVASSTSPGAMRRVVLHTWQDKLKAALEGKKPRVEQINLSVFGFSRGAAEARAFVNWLFEVCKQEGGGWTFAGLPIRLQFLGIFDTVASVGLANLYDNGVLAGHQSWGDNTQEIHPAVEQCVHFVAGHEVRACFPLDSVRIKSSYPPNAMEVMYPGAHSDVGGGYAPGALGVSPTVDSSMSIIPGVNMYHEARKAGVPLLPLDELAPVFRQALTPSGSVIRDFNGYLKDAKLGSGPVEVMHRRHMGWYFGYRFKCRNEFESMSPYASSSTEDKDALRKTQTAFLKRLSLNLANPSDPSFDPKTVVKLHKDMNKASGLQPTTKDKMVYDIVEHMDVGGLTPNIEAMCGKYIHDSMAGFINFGMNEYLLNGLGLGKFRTVFKGND